MTARHRCRYQCSSPMGSLALTPPQRDLSSSLAFHMSLEGGMLHVTAAPVGLQTMLRTTNTTLVCTSLPRKRRYTVEMQGSTDFGISSSTCQGNSQHLARASILPTVSVRLWVPPVMITAPVSTTRIPVLIPCDADTHYMTFSVPCVSSYAGRCYYSQRKNKEKGIMGKRGMFKPKTKAEQARENPSRPRVRPSFKRTGYGTVSVGRMVN
ncbi:hypothetical protein LY76DRAFT_6909 [Colletotrichum caudatum]|nr:hypothetical protein LY76DRAFT_6909 [Colletotrichum caudatum]